MIVSMNTVLYMQNLGVTPHSTFITISLACNMHSLTQKLKDLNRRWCIPCLNRACQDYSCWFISRNESIQRHNSIINEVHDLIR